MTRITKFQTASIRIGAFGGESLSRIILVSAIISTSVYFLRFSGLISSILIPVFLLKFQDDYVDELIFKKIRGGSLRRLSQIYSPDSEFYEIKGINYGFSSSQDDYIITAWSRIISLLPDRIVLIKLPYKIPTDQFKIGREDYDSLFCKEEYWGEAYFLRINKNRSEEVEKILGSAGVAFKKLSENEMEVLNGLI